MRLSTQLDRRWTWLQIKVDRRRRNFNVHEAKNSLWDILPYNTDFYFSTLFLFNVMMSAPTFSTASSLNTLSQELAFRIFVYLSPLSLKALHSRMKCFFVFTFSELQKMHTLSSQASFGFFQRPISQRI